MAELDQRISRGEFLKIAGTTAAGFLAAACSYPRPDPGWEQALDRRGDMVRADMAALELDRPLEVVSFQDLTGEERKALNFYGPRVGYISLMNNETARNLGEAFTNFFLPKINVVVRLTRPTSKEEDWTKYDQAPRLYCLRLPYASVRRELDESITKPQATLNWDLSRFINHNSAWAQKEGGDGFRIDRFTSPKGYLERADAITTVVVKGQEDRLRILNR